MSEYIRPLAEGVFRLREPRRFIQVLAGPRQAGKTTLIRQTLDRIDRAHHYASADAPVGQGLGWLEAQWTIGRHRAGEHENGAILVLDEIQKIMDWSAIVKALWDDDTAAATPLQVVLLGSAPLLVQRGLNESLAGRFEITRVRHWSLAEMQTAFGFDLNTYVAFGGYPGAAPLVADEERWRAYILDSLIETSIARDVLLLNRITKPALLRQLFGLACAYSGQVLSYTKMLGQLQDAGNTTTLAHYLDLLSGAGLVAGLQKFSGSEVRRRGSSPKLLALNTALVTALDGRPVDLIREDRATWGRLVETAVGAHLVNGLTDPGHKVQWWREGNDEVDFVLVGAGRTVAIEVKATTQRRRATGLDTFRSTHTPEATLIVGTGGLELERFLTIPPAEWLS